MVISFIMGLLETTRSANSLLKVGFHNLFKCLWVVGLGYFCLLSLWTSSLSSV